MGISATVNAAFLIDTKTYTASISIPNSTPTATAPFNFNVSSQAPTPSGGTAPAPQVLLQVAVGASGQVYVAVSPPMDLISTAVGSDIVQKLNVVVAEGNYNSTTNSFS